MTLVNLLLEFVVGAERDTRRYKRLRDTRSFNIEFIVDFFADKF